jgi:hypothetical protein
VSATARSTIDTCRWVWSICLSDYGVNVTLSLHRTLFIWIVSLYLGWERFSWIQVIGFSVMVLGTFIFNGVIKPPFSRSADSAEAAPLLREDDGEQ